ncbi:MAG: hypothetical protein NTY59_16125 [Alphaproteobacteria bacterium]|nr:hypothetical protein [Alphaproteobacteria bacterium]
MLRNQALALCLVIGGLVGNNYAYLHDLVTGKFPDGAIHLGMASFIAIGFSLAVIIAGLVLLLAGPRRP